MKKVIDLLKATFKEFSEDKVPRLAAALAYYTIFSIGPLLIIIVAIASLVYQNGEAKKQISDTISSLMGPGADPILKSLDQPQKGGSIIASIIGIVTLLLGASGVFGQLKDALNTMWEVKPKEGQGILAMLRERFLSFSMVLGTGFLLLVSLVVSAGLAAVGKWLASVLPGGDIIGNIANYLVTLLIITAMFALLFRFLPDAKVAWKDVWIGAGITAILFVVGQIALGIYLGSGSIGTTFGAAGSIVVALVWIYYSSLIFFIGAELTQTYARLYGSKIEIAPYAEPMAEGTRVTQGIPHKGGKEVSPDKEAGKSDKDGKPRKSLRASPWFQ